MQSMAKFRAIFIAKLSLKRDEFKKELEKELETESGESFLKTILPQAIAAIDAFIQE